MKNKRSLIIIGIMLIMFVPLIVSAQTPLVPCGTSYASTPCSLCHLFTLTQRILNFLAWVAINEMLLFFTNTSVDGAAKIDITNIPLPWHKIECVIPEVTITPPLPSRATESTATYRSDQGIRDELRDVGI